jgi:hypothetical protein
LTCPLSELELTVLREMMLEMFDDHRLMKVGNCLLFIDDEIKRRKDFVATEERDCQDT